MRGPSHAPPMGDGHGKPEHTTGSPAWNKGKLVSQEVPLELKDIRAIRVRLWLRYKVRDPALFNLAIDSKSAPAIWSASGPLTYPMGARWLIGPWCCGKRRESRSIRDHSDDARISPGLGPEGRPEALGLPIHSRVTGSPQLSTRQYARIVHRWVEDAVLEAGSYGTHTMRRTKASLIYRRTRNLRAVQLLLRHTKLERTVPHLGIEVDDALELAEQTDV